MKKALLKELGKGYRFEDNILVDVSVTGFDHHRNVAIVRYSHGMLHIKKYNADKRWFGDATDKRWFGDETSFTSVSEAAKFIRSK